jgi:anti-anti-sigma regulatory factor
MHTPFSLPSEINIYNVLETREALLTWVSEQVVKGSERLEVSARDVTDVDGSGLQLLAALSNMEHSWRLIEASAPFAQACRTIGFGHWVDARVAA